MNLQQREMLKDLDEFLQDTGDYIDFEKYVIPHNTPDKHGADTFSCWRYTLCFTGDKLSGSYFDLLINDPDGWTDKLPPIEHVMDVWNDLAAFVKRITPMVEGRNP